MKLKDTIALLILATMVSGCASGRATYDASELAGPAEQGPTSEYVIGPGDALQIFVWDHDDLSTNVQVRPDGKISTPLVEDLEASGRTPTELAREIEGVLSEYVRTPVVTVIMQGFVGEQTQLIRVVGQAVAPQSLQFRNGMTVLDVVIQVGGLSEFAAGNRAKIVRKTQDGQIDIKVRLDDLINKGDIEENILMRPGDVLIIPQSWL